MKNFRMFYLNKKDNRSIIAFFTCIIIINGIAIMKKNDILGDMSSFITIIVAALSALFSVKIEKEEYTASGYKDERKRIFAGPISYKDINEQNQNLFEKILLERKKHRENIKTKIEKMFTEQAKGFRGMIITGDSGSGKSILINKLEKDLLEAGYHVAIKRDSYNRLALQLRIDKKNVVFLDHFEKAMGYKGYIESMKSYAEDYDTVFIFSFPQNVLSSIQGVLDKYFNNVIQDIYILSINQEDKKNCINRISDFIGCDVKDVISCVEQIELGEHTERNSFKEILCEELVAISEGKAPLIEFELLGYILSNDVDEDKKINNKFSFIDLYLDSWVKEFPHEETAYALLYLLSESRAYSIEDVKLAAFENKEYFSADYDKNIKGKMLIALENNPFIHIYTGKENVLFFEPMHDYVVQQLRRYCANKNISEGTRYYIDYLKKCIEGKDQAMQKYKNIYKSIKDNYRSYYDIKKDRPIFAMLILMYICIAAINIFSIWNVESDNIHYQYIWNSVSSMPAIYYIYNYCIRFFKMKNSAVVKLTYMAGAVIIVLTYLIKNCWGIFMGAEVIILAISIYFALEKQTYQDAKKLFLKDFFVFLTLGVIIVGLGAIFCIIFSSNNVFSSRLGECMLKYSYYIEFACYAILSVYAHVNYKYIMGRIGYANIVADIDGIDT